MKTTKSVQKSSQKSAARSPMQITIVAFVLLFVAITAMILVMYFKWFANDQLGAPAAVNVVGVDKNVSENQSPSTLVEENNIEDQALLSLTDDELFENLYGYIEWPQDKIDLIKVNDGCQVLGSVLSNAGDQLVYFEKCGITSKVVLMNLTSKQEKLLYSKEVVNDGYNTFDYVPLERDPWDRTWSPQDTKIVLRMVIGSADGGNPSDESIFKIIDVKSAKDESLQKYDVLLGFVIGKSGDENLLYLSEMSKAVCVNLMGPYTKLIQRNSNTGKEIILVESENGIYAHVDNNGKIVVQEAVPTQEVPEMNCIDSAMGPEQIVELK